MSTLRKIEVNNAGEYGTFFVVEDCVPRENGTFRHSCQLEADGARVLWDELEDADLDSEHAHTLFVYGSSHWYEEYSDGNGPKCKRRNPQAEGFWEQLWPDFIKKLQEATP